MYNFCDIKLLYHLFSFLQDQVPRTPQFLLAASDHELSPEPGRGCGWERVNRGVTPHPLRNGATSGLLLPSLHASRRAREGGLVSLWGYQLGRLSWPSRPGFRDHCSGWARQSVAFAKACRDGGGWAGCGFLRRHSCRASSSLSSHLFCRKSPQGQQVRPVSPPFRDRIGWLGSASAHALGLP